MIPNFWEPPLRSVFENQLVYSLWEPALRKLAEIFSLKILKPCSVFLKINVFLKSWDGSYKCHWKLNPVVLNKNWEPAYPSPRSGFADEPHPRLPVQGHTLSTCGDFCLSILTGRCVLQVVTLDFMISLCLQFWPVVAVVCLQISSAVNHHFEPSIQFQSVDIGTVGEGNSKIDGDI